MVTGTEMNRLRWAGVRVVVVHCRECGAGVAMRNPGAWRGSCRRCQQRRANAKRRGGARSTV